MRSVWPSSQENSKRTVAVWHSDVKANGTVTDFQTPPESQTLGRRNSPGVKTNQHKRQRTNLDWKQALK